MTSSRSVVARRRTQVLGSLGVMAAAAAVAGLGTFGTFTDSTTPLSTGVSSGTVSIDVSQRGATIPATTANFVPGDSMTRAVDLVNDGTSPLGRVSLASTASAASVLTTDAANGLQLSVRSCPVAWTQGGTASAPTYTCAGPTTLYSGRAVMDAALPGVASLQPGGIDHLVVTVSLPSSAGTAFQDKSATLGLTFTGVQTDGTAR
ncbi:TasA family protein [Blastococcus sp. URHD0036]|uniref:TasA family protein n=1 Tax=Blastococcus sp. URHD0036 TaxID=1380356 RepID=UPI0005538331|nr:TasA family protein [Blastococcus sp. URHD0036]